MSAWSLGATPRPAMALRAAPGTPTLKTFVDRVIIWIPGDVVGFYVAAVAALGADKPKVWLLVLAVVLAPVMVILGAKSTPEAKRPQKVGRRAVLATFATIIWTLTVPGAGWQEATWFADHVKEVAIAAAALGLVFGPLASIWVPGDGS